MRILTPTAMKRLVIVTLLLAPMLCLAQTGKPQADLVIQKVLTQLEKIKQVNYQQTREMRYFADNYQNRTSADIYIDFTAGGPLGLRFQGDNGQSVVVYNGQTLLYLKKEDKTIDSSTARTAKSMQSNSYLFHSLAMVRTMLHVVLSNDSLHRTVSDTLINGKPYFQLRIEGDQMYFQLLGGLEHYSNPNLRRPYYLIIDKATYLPYQLVAKLIRGTDDRDYITVTYDRINTKPDVPSVASWDYATYTATYKPYVAPVKIPIVKPGTLLADFTLPNYTPTGIDSVSLNKYKGKIVLVDFWFKSCGPCMEAMPKYNELQNQFRKEGFELLTVNVEDPVEDIKFFYNKHQPVYKMLYNGGKLWSGLGFTACPSSVLVDQSGKVVEAIYGFNKEELSKKIAALIKKD